MIYQLIALQRYLNSQILKHSFTNQVLLQMLSNYLNFVNKSLLDIPESYSLLEYFYEIRDMMDEIVFIHKLCFWKSTFSEDLSKTYRIRTDTENFDLFYSISETLHDCSQSQFIVRSLMQESIKHLAKLIHSMLFKEPSVDILKSTLKLEFKRNSLGDFEFSGIPKIFSKTMQPLFLAVQVLSLLRKYEPEFYRILTSWQSYVETSYDPEALSASLASTISKFEDANRLLSLALASIQVERDKKKLELMHKRLDRLKQIKGDIERQHEDKEKLRQIEIFKRVQLQHFLQQQIEEKRVKNKFERELRVEAERNELLDRVLKQKQAEKLYLLSEIEGIGKGVDDEIERALIKETLEKVNLREEDEDVEINRFELENNTSLTEDVASNLPNIQINRLADSVILSKDQSSNLGASTHDLPTVQEISMTADQYLTVNPTSIKVNLRDSFAELVEASFKSKANDSIVIEEDMTSKNNRITNELDYQSEQLALAFNTPRIRQENSVILENSKMSPSNRTEKKLRQVKEKDMGIDLKDVSKLVLSNLVQMSKVHLAELEEENLEEKADQK